MAQQTAVDWLIEQLARKNNEFQALTFYYDHKKEIEQAKQIEKQQRITDYNIGYQDAQCNHINDGENYANECDYINHKQP